MDEENNSKLRCDCCEMGTKASVIINRPIKKKSTAAADVIVMGHGERGFPLMLQASRDDG